MLHQGHGSGIPRGRYVAQVTRNRLLTLVKNVPSRLLLRHWPTLLYGQIYFFLVYRRPLASFVGYLGFLGRLPGALRQRREAMAERTVALQDLDGMLSSELVLDCS